jgi:hypothetical protein
VSAKPSYRLQFQSTRNSCREVVRPSPVTELKIGKWKYPSTGKLLFRCLDSTLYNRFTCFHAVK